MTTKQTRLVPTLLLAFVGGVTLASTSTASAQTLVGDGVYAFANQALYEDSESSLVDAITFNGLAKPTTDPYFGSPGSLSTGGVSFTTPSGTQLYTVGAQYYAASTGHHFDFDGTPTLEVEYGSPNVLKATLPSDASPLPAVTAFGTQFGAGFTAAPILTTVDLVNGDTVSFTYNASDAEDGLGFVGFVSTDGSAIKSVQFSDSTRDGTGQILFVLDNVTYGVVTTVVPEPGVLSLMLVGAAGLAFFFRRRIALS